ncbi:TlyA family RNA methyltransferase [Zavarzinia sp. CC-PAN008]|uniref:TlyA family RNA methyltransferase n=1 Tax=Zavarzinia sp. CC-PAN008 TaxID=3243332 RepID=UPI003F7451B6
MAKVPRERLDALLVARGLADNRTRAQALILAGKVFSGERRLDKAGATLDPAVALTVRGAEHPWVSRGALKLIAGLDAFAVPVQGRVALDVGASTGGFTEVLLARGAARVHAVDVGQGQLAWSLRTDPRVVVLEKTNARHLTTAEVAEPVDIVTCDASFIGLETVLPTPLSLTRPGAHLVALIKPQFEVGRDGVGKGGIVRDAGLREAARARIVDWLGNRPGWRVLGTTESPITGADGNVEYLIAGVRDA